ncbi:hypothetical protein, partial [Fulvivirga lutimaris]|uniref:hypothetical protein n=1 Tax=Fulvivirga lutimaris TaxID=1819566 RepID=UPI00162A10EE
IALTDKDSWCSTGGAYTTIGATGTMSSSSIGTFYNDLWFTFTADNPFLQLELVPGTLGTNARMVIQDASGNEIYGANSTNEYKFVKEDLTAGAQYYVIVGSRIGGASTSYNGTFDLCLNDIPTNDYRQGAIALTDK